MALRIAQDFTYEATDWWRWWVWIDGSEPELDRIDHVVYQLHPTFPEPVRTVSDRSTKFRLETAGWGEFTIYARAFTKDGKQVKLEHDLQLRYPDGRATTN